MIFWMISYFSFGFYAVFRIILLVDAADEKKGLYLAGLGLLVGRIGDALGEGLLLTLEARPVLLILMTSLLFAAAVAVFFKLYPLLYLPRAEVKLSKEEQFERFALSYDLSPRERELMRLILEEKTGGEIADALSISENTVKYHVRNILQKTGCKNRKELLVLYLDRED